MRWARCGSGGGEVEEAASDLQPVDQAGPVQRVTHYDVALFLNLSGMYKTAQKQLDLAHTLSPADPEIEERWNETHAVPLTSAQRLERLKAQLGKRSLPDEEKQGIEAAIKAIETREKGSCELVSPMTEVTLPILPIVSGATQRPEDMYAARAGGAVQRQEKADGDRHGRLRAAAEPVGGQERGSCSGARDQDRGYRRRGCRGCVCDARRRYQDRQDGVQELHGPGCWSRTGWMWTA